jgi:hypothetical protein
MIVKKLYVVKDGGYDIDMLLTHCLLNPIDYKQVRAECRGHESESVRAMFHEECIDLLEYEVIKGEHKRTLNNVADDIYYGVYLSGRVDMRSILFIAETEDGEYVQFDMKTVDMVKRKELEEEEL